MQLSRRYAHLGAVALALGFCLRLYATALALLVVPALVALFAFRQGVAHLSGTGASTGIADLDAVLVNPPFAVSAAAVIAPLAVICGVAWLVFDWRSFQVLATKAVQFGLRHGRMQARLDDDGLAARLAAFATFMRTFSVAMPGIAIVLIFALCTLASWAAAHALTPADVFEAASLGARTIPPGYRDHVVYWADVVVNFVLIDAPQTFGWSLSGLKLNGKALHLLAMNWLLGLTMIWMVAEFFSFAFNLRKHPRAASLKALVENTETHVREQWRQADAAEQDEPAGAAADSTADGGAAQSGEALPGDEDLPSDEELLATVPQHLMLVSKARMAVFGFAVGAGAFVLGLTVVAVVAAALLAVGRLAVAAFGALPVLTAAGLSIVPLYFAIEVAFKLVDRGRMERRFASLFGSVVLAGRMEPADTLEGKLMSALHSVLMLTWLRATLAAFLGLALVFQCLYAAWITSSAMAVWPGLELFAGGERPAFGEIARFWLDIPLDIFLLGAPDLFGFGLSALAHNPQNTWFVVIVFVFKAVLFAEAVGLILAIWNTVADVYSKETHAELAELRRRADAASSG